MDDAQHDSLHAIYGVNEQIRGLMHDRLLLLVNHRIVAGDKKGRLQCGRLRFQWSLGLKVEIYYDESNNKEFYFSCSVQYLADLEEKYA